MKTRSLPSLFLSSCLLIFSQSESFGEPVYLDAEQDYDFLLRAERAPEARRNGEYGIRIAGATTATLSDFIAVDPSRAYQLAGWFRTADGSECQIRFGLECYDADRQLIKLEEVNYNVGTLCRLLEDAKEGDKFIVTDGSRTGFTAHPFMPVAFNAAGDCSDLPNRELSSAPVSLEPYGVGVKVSFAEPLSRNYPAGTPVRQHRRIGQTELWDSFTVTGQWHEQQYETTGGNTRILAPNRFHPGTGFVRIVVRNSGSKETDLYADDLSLVASGDAQAESFQEERPYFRICTDRLAGLYDCGEEAEFRLIKQVRGLEEITEGTLTATFTLDGGRVISTQSQNLDGSPVVFRETLQEPGFLRCSLVYDDGQRKHPPVVSAAAGFDVAKIRPGADPPTDLLDYWHGELERLEREVPLDLQTTRIRNDSAYRGFRLSAANFNGKRITAGLTIPQKGEKFPLVVTVPGAGDASKPISTFAGAIGLSISVFERVFGPGDYAAFNKPKWYFYQGATSREDYYYHLSIIGAMRMVRYIQTIPEWDGRNLIFVGFSQGGGFSLMLAALFNESATGVIAGQPALCDHFGREASRRAGWPQLLAHEPQAAGFAAYFDAALFASHIKCPAIVSAGFIDTMCTPSSVYAAFNSIPGAKQIFNAPQYAHGSGVNSPGFDDARKKALKDWLLQ